MNFEPESLGRLRREQEKLAEELQQAGRFISAKVPRIMTIIMILPMKTILEPPFKAVHGSCFVTFTRLRHYDVASEEVI